jgi:hypothetical protein
MQPLFLENDRMDRLWRNVPWDGIEGCFLDALVNDKWETGPAGSPFGTAFGCTQSISFIAVDYETDAGESYRHKPRKSSLNRSQSLAY